MTDRFTERLSEFIDGELDPATRAELEAHLRGCGECRTTVADLRRLVAQARALPPRAPDETVWAAVSREIAAAAEAPREPNAPPTSRRLPPSLLAAAALLVAVALGASGSAWWHASRAPSTPSATLDAAGSRWLLLLHTGSGPRTRPATGESMATIIGHYAAWRREHALIGEKLASGTGVRLDPDGDSPAASSSDPIGGLYIIAAKDEAEATAIARTCPHLDYGGWIELRRIEDTSHVR